MRFSDCLLSSVAVACLCAAPAQASPASPPEADTVDAQGRSGDEVIVIGKSYGREVGKTITPLKDVPNTVTLIDREQIEAQNLFTLEDAMTATNGVTVTGIGSEDPSYVSRGFAITNYLVDGVPTLSFGFPGVVPDLFGYDRLEVLRGPAGLFSGSGSPAGSINLVRKRPLDEDRITASAGYGSYDNLRLEADASARIGGRAGVRVGAMLQDQDQFFDIAHRKRWGGFAVGELEIGNRTTLTAGVYYDRFKPAIQSGLPGYAGGADGSDGRLLDVRRSTYLGADWNRFDAETTSAFVEIAHKVSDRWTLRATGSIANVDRIDVYSYIGNQAVTTQPVGTTPTNNGVTNHIAYRGDNHQKTRAFDVNGIGSFPLFGRDQTLILGVDYQAQDYTSDFTRLSNYARIDVFNPVSPLEPPLDPYGALPPYPVQGTDGNCAIAGRCVTQVYGGTITQVEQYGLYGQTRISPVAGLTLVGGGRLTFWDTNTQTTRPQPSPVSGYGVDGRFTPYVAALWDITDNLNVYASYSDSFTPQVGPGGRTRADGARTEPLIGDQYEAGTKLALFDERLLLSLAGYQIVQKNRIINDLDDATLFVQAGRVRARGVEAEASGQILPGWRVNGGYTYTKTKYLEDAQPQFNGIPLTPIIPKHMVKVFTNYAPVDGPLAGASIGGALTWFASTYGGNPAIYRPDGSVLTRSTIVRQGDYAVVDVRAGYKLNDRIGLSVNVNNVFDKVYYSRISSTGRGNYYGSPRTVFATLRVSYP
ncbi:TonB-dependent siderophore receptor [Sphingomonas sp. 3-13AW]|uniref:TonB-dependent siderophore receptor n=1 Tax=Sphingomonas sp. 3-13AW TaxID=3050450 RepID=UPI003BB76E8E